MINNKNKIGNDSDLEINKSMLVFDIQKLLQFK